MSRKKIREMGELSPLQNFDRTIQLKQCVEYFQ